MPQGTKAGVKKIHPPQQKKFTKINRQTSLFKSFFKTKF
jgi:hypothetical protein